MSSPAGANRSDLAHVISGAPGWIWFNERLLKRLRGGRDGRWSSGKQEEIHPMLRSIGESGLILTVFWKMCRLTFLTSKSHLLPLWGNKWDRYPHLHSNPLVALSTMRPRRNSTVGLNCQHPSFFQINAHTSEPRYIVKQPWRGEIQRTGITAGPITAAAAAAARCVAALRKWKESRGSGLGWVKKEKKKKSLGANISGE